MHSNSLIGKCEAVYNFNYGNSPPSIPLPLSIDQTSFNQFSNESTNTSVCFKKISSYELTSY